MSHVVFVPAELMADVRDRARRAGVPVLDVAVQVLIDAGFCFEIVDDELEFSYDDGVDRTGEQPPFEVDGGGA